MRVLSFAVLLLTIAPARLQADFHVGHEACLNDAATLCPQAPGGAERFKCLEAQGDKLSPQCKTHLEDLRAAGRAFRDDCATDIGAACLNFQGHALIECLEAQGDKLSKACSERIAAIKGARRAAHERIHAVCKEDAQKFCGAAATGGVNDCLRANSASLTTACANAVKK